MNWWTQNWSGAAAAATAETSAIATTSTITMESGAAAAAAARMASRPARATATTRKSATPLGAAFTVMWWVSVTATWGMDRAKWAEADRQLVSSTVLFQIMKQRAGNPAMVLLQKK